MTARPVADVAAPRAIVASRPSIVALLAVAAIVTGALGRAAGATDVVARGWLIALVVLGAPIVWEMLLAARRGLFATDLVAAAAIIVAVLLRQPLPGLVIVLMQAGGEALERYAEGRASAAVRALEAAAPRMARRVRGNDVDDVPA